MYSYRASINLSLKWRGNTKVMCSVFNQTCLSERGFPEQFFFLKYFEDGGEMTEQVFA